MLEKDPNKRITIPEIMAHPWIAKYKEQKIRAEWGYSDSDNDSFNIDEEDGDGNSPATDSTKIDS
jgi:serine/threonine protein kinase